MALPFSVDAFSSRNKGIGDLKNLLVKISLGKAHARDQRSTARRSPRAFAKANLAAAFGAKRPFMRQVATTNLAVDRQFEHG